MPVEICKQCGEVMMEQPAAYESVNLPSAARHSYRFYEQWFACRNGHRRGYISGQSRPPGDMRVMSQTDVISIRT
jgi:hypothetical protein